MDGFYKEEDNQPSSSSGSLAGRLFDEYRQAVFIVENDRVPGIAFKNGLPYMELKVLDLQTLASVESQLQFYQEARIKIAIFMGCKTGEIELGISNDTQLNLEMEMRNWFPEDFSRQAPARELPTPADQIRPSSPSSSVRSLSMDTLDSSEYSPFLFNIPSTSQLQDPPEEAPIGQALRPISNPISPLHQATQPFLQIPKFQFPILQETKDPAMEKAISGVLSSSSRSPLQPPQNNIPANYPLSQKPGAFKRYGSSSFAALTPLISRSSARRPNLQKKAIRFFRSLGLMRIQERVQGSHPTSSTQLHHMISERKRREKLNERFQALRSLLPPETKKDKASVLAKTTEFLASLKAQVAELSERKRDMEAKLLLREEATHDHEEGKTLSSNVGRLDVQVTQEERTSERRIVGLQVIVRGESNLLDMVIRIMEFLKKVQNIGLMSVEADARVVESNFINLVRLRLKIERDEWDESAFQEAVWRVVADLAQ
ncbi:hypothetical protein U1Q18_028734 [Sarracenia purpurea var. burkii]